MQQFQRRTVSVQGIDLSYDEAGEGPPVVYLHGAVTTLDEGMIALESTLAPRFRLLAIDRPGHGESGRDLTTGSAWRQAQLLREAASSLGVERPVVIGHSFGGAVAMAWALQYPDDLAGVVAIAPVAFPEPRLEQVLFGMRAVPGAGDWLSVMAVPVDAVLMPMLWNGMFLPQAMTPEFKAGFPFDVAGGRGPLRADGEEAAMMMSSLGRNALNYWRCRTPVHVLQGDGDKVVNPALHGKALAAVLPRARYTGFRGLGHMLHHFEPEAVAEAAAELHGLGAGRAALAA